MNPCELTIAGSDSGAGAGIQADLKTFSALGVYGLTVLTMVTAQSTTAVEAVQILPVDLVLQQLRTVLSDFKVAALKTGALGDGALIHAVAGLLKPLGSLDLVVDPVMVSKHGDALIADEAVAVLSRELLPLARVVTPNLPEAARLAGMDRVSTRGDMLEAAVRISDAGCRAVVVKGGHSAGEPVDLLYENGNVIWLGGPRVPTKHTHGTGCTFSAAIAAYLARRLPLADAVRQAKEYLTQALRHGQLFGRGINPPNHFWQTQPRFGRLNADPLEAAGGYQESDETGGSPEN